MFEKIIFKGVHFEIVLRSLLSYFLLIKKIQMKKLFLILLPFLLFACATPKATETAKETPSISPYPEALQKVFETHGGIDTWKSMQSLTFGIVRDAGTEMNYVNLWDRRDKIEGSDFSMGYDGKDVWLKADTSYKGNPLFFHNLMFYFYAMPFVLADDGINYSEGEALTFEGKTYPAIRIRFNSGVGSADLDEYILYYDPETYQMAFLGYTATYFSKERKENFSKIRYNDWTDVNGIMLPNSATWYKVEDGVMTEPRNTVTFDQMKLSTSPHADEVFAMPEGGKVVE